jgi:hypothetical protein
MLDNFFILLNGNLIYSKHCHGTKLDSVTLLGLSSCFSMLLGRKRASSDTKSDEVSVRRSCSLSVNKATFAFVEFGPYILIAQGSSQQTSMFFELHLENVQELLLFYLGNFARDASDIKTIKGIFIYIDALLQSYSQSLRSIVRGNNWVFLEEDTRDALDGMMATLEGNDTISGSMLVLGSSILHSRLGAFETRMLLQNLAAAPLGISKMRAAPVSLKGVWSTAVFFRLQAHTLVVLAKVQTSPSMLIAPLESFETTFADSTLQLPAEEPPFLLRHYAGLDTVAFTYVHTPTKICVAPPPRPGPKDAQTSAIANFSYFFGRMQTSLESSPGECLITKNGYRFYGTITKDYQLFAVFSDSIGTEQLRRNVTEILTNVQRHNAGLLI